MLNALPANLLQAPPAYHRQFRSASPPRARNPSRNLLVARPLVFTTPTTVGGAQRNWLKETTHRNEALAQLLAPNSNGADERPQQLQKQMQQKAHSQPFLASTSRLLHKSINWMPFRLVPAGPRREGGTRRKRLEWEVPISEMGVAQRRDLVRRLAGELAVEKQPNSLIYSQALKDLLLCAPTGPGDLIECLPDIIPSLRTSLSSRMLWKRLEALELLREMVQLRGVGSRLLPHFRALLPPLRNGLIQISGYEPNMNTRERLAVAVHKTLLALEQWGGPGAGQSIKQILPEYQSIEGLRMRN